MTWAVFKYFSSAPPPPILLLVRKGRQAGRLLKNGENWTTRTHVPRLCLPSLLRAWTYQTALSRVLGFLRFHVRMNEERLRMLADINNSNGPVRKSRSEASINARVCSKSGSSSNEAYGVPDNLVQQVWSSPQLRSTIPSVLNAFKSVYPAMAQELIQISDPANKQYIWSRCTSRDSDDNVQLLLARTDVLSVDSSHLVCVKKFVDYSCVLMIWAELVVEYNETELLCAEASSMFNSSDAQ